jgi:hypothetical protein
VTTLPTDLERTTLPSPTRTDEPSRLDRFRITLRRWSRWEFWPAWLVYALLLPQLVRLSLRHRSLTIFAAANPGMPLGGFVGESKLEILKRLPREWTVPTHAIEPDAVDARLDALDSLARVHELCFPLVLKPDVGERGTDVKLVRNPAEAAAYFARVRSRVLVQPYHPGPFEAGIFYVRRPGEPRGMIFSITDKVQPRVTGDGRSSLRSLIWRDPRLALQAATLLQQLGPAADRVPSSGERVLLSIAGNHCRGTMFLDGHALITPALERRIDEIARSYEGFFFGRFDLRYANPADFANGEGFRIVELNGVLSESTNIYDPSWSLRRGLRTLADQWTLAFEIGAANAKRGTPIPRVRELLDAALSHRRRTR